jgi:adenosylcobinamide-GDP ribazoletransferase
MTSPDDPYGTANGPPNGPPNGTGRPASFDDWLQAFKEQASFFTGLKLDVGAPRWPLADVLPVLPVIGAAIGLAAGVVFTVVRGLAGPGWLAGVLAVGAAIILTRALHEDGLADTADGLGPHALEPARRLEIMRDSHNGTFGVLALALSVLIKVACLAQFSGATGLIVLIGAHALSRAVLAWPILAFSPVHSDGLGAQVGKPTDNDVWLTIGIGVVLAFLLLLGQGFFVALLAPLAAVAAAWGASRWIADRIGGYTGDTLGAVQQKAEIAFLVVAALFIGR